LRRLSLVLYSIPLSYDFPKCLSQLGPWKSHGLWKTPEKLEELQKGDGKRGKARPKLALAGAVVLAMGIFLIYFVVDVRNFDPASQIGFAATIAGGLMLLFSMIRRNQLRVAKGMDVVRDVFKDQCQCCKCQNCGRNHNHWTHD
jgi:hypothetical protein